MRVKMFCSISHKGLEKQVNRFLQENEGRIRVTEIKWRIFLEHYAMIVHEEIQQSE